MAACLVVVASLARAEVRVPSPSLGVQFFEGGSTVFAPASPSCPGSFIARVFPGEPLEGSVTLTCGSATIGRLGAGSFLLHVLRGEHLNVPAQGSWPEDVDHAVIPVAVERLDDSRYPYIGQFSVSLSALEPGEYTSYISLHDDSVPPECRTSSPWPILSYAGTVTYGPAVGDGDKWWQLLRAGRRHLRLGQLAEAEAAVQSLLLAYPNSSHAHVLRADVKLAQADKPGAVAALKAAKQLLEANLDTRSEAANDAVRERMLTNIAFNLAVFGAP